MDPVTQADVDNPAAIDAGCACGQFGDGGGFSGSNGCCDFARQRRVQRPRDDRGEQLDEALTTFSDLQDASGQVMALLNCARLLGFEGHYVESALLLGAKRALAKEIPTCSAIGQHHLEAMRRKIDPERVATAFATGEALSLSDAVAYAHSQLEARDQGTIAARVTRP